MYGASCTENCLAIMMIRNLMCFKGPLFILFLTNNNNILKIFMYILISDGKVFIMTKSKPTSALGLKHLHAGKWRK